MNLLRLSLSSTLMTAVALAGCSGGQTTIPADSGVDATSGSGGAIDAGSGSGGSGVDAGSGGKTGSGGAVGSGGKGSGGAVGSGGKGSGGAVGSGGKGSGGSGSGGSGSGGSGSGGSTTCNSGLSGCTIPSFICSEKAPIGWASQGGGTTGGGSATPVLVTSLSDLNSQLNSGTTAKVIYVKGNLADGTLNIKSVSNKTIIGCSEGATINGHLQISSATNIILRNLNIVGYNCAPPDVDTSAGGECQNGQDAVTVQTSTRLWFDHDAVSDGSDGSLDFVHATDYVTVSYSKLFYSTKRSDPNDTGAAGHRYFSLIGNDDDNGSEDSGHLRITFHHNWWAANLMERMPRIRFGQVHLFNNLWSAAGNNYCIGVGVGANVLNEYNAFIGVKTPINTTSYSDGNSIAKSANNLYSGTSGNPVADLKPGSVFAPPYAYTPIAATAVQADVQANAGPK